jgi:hypothetical protein
MPLASGADVAIGSYEFMLSTNEEGSGYEWLLENLYGDEGDIAGTEGKKAANKNILFWGYDDFRRGDGLRYWDKDQPDRWWSGNANPRIPGAITSVPTRSIATTITTSVTPTQGFFVSAGGNLWYFTGEQGYHSTDGATWTENTDVATELPASYQITAACSDGQDAYIAASDGTNRGIWVVTSTTVVSDFVTAHANAAAFKGIAIRDNYLYAWTGGHLFRYDTQATLPITHSASAKKFAAGGETPTGTAYVSMASGEHSVVFTRAWDGHTTVYEYKADPQTNQLGPKTTWNMPLGFTGKKICVSTGILYVLGEFADKVGLWGWSFQTNQPFFLGYIGEANAVNNVRFIAPSYGAQVLIGVDNGTTSYIYIYDAEEDSFSQLDERTITADGTLTAGATYKNRRVSAAFATTSSKINRWVPDTSTPAGAWTWVSAAHDFDFPQDEKVLLGFHVIADPTISAGTVQVEWQQDEDGVWLNAGTGAAGEKYKFWTISDANTTRKFRTLRLRVTGASGARLFSITARAYINSKQEVWRLKLDLHNEPGTTRKPSNRASSAEKLRDNLRTLATNGDVVTFKDGTRKRRKSSTDNTGYTSHTVLVEFPKGSIDSLREGTAEVILRSVAPSA